MFNKIFDKFEHMGDGAQYLIAITVGLAFTAAVTVGLGFEDQRERREIAAANADRPTRPPYATIEGKQVACTVVEAQPKIYVCPVQPTPR